MECPTCAHEQESGNFCAECGTRLDGTCPSCDAELVPGGRFCTQCGERVAGTRGSGAGGRNQWPWYLGAATLAVVLLVLLLPRRAERAGPPAMTSPARTAPAGNAPGPAPGLLSSDMRTNADRLFNRVMTAAEQEDRAQVTQFVPMAIQAYEMVEDLDDDGVYHLALLHLTAGQFDQAREAARRTLDREPDHILALGISARAAAEAGDDSAAEEMYRRLLDVYGEEAARPLLEYQEHQQMLPEYRRMAREYLGD